MSRLLARTRAEFGTSPRNLTRYDHFDPPPWMARDDALRDTYAQRRQLLRTGDVVWGHIVQANAALWRAGDQAAPASVIFAARQGDDFDPDRLEAPAEAAFALKGKKPPDPALAAVAAALTDEMRRHPPLDLPDAITRGARLRMAMVMVHRAMLPRPFLVNRFLPLVADPARESIAILAARHWSEDLVRAWVALA